MKLVFEDNHLCKSLYGERENHLRILEDVIGISIHSRGNELQLAGDETKIELAANLLNQFYTTLKKGFSLYENEIRQGAISLLKDHDLDVTQIFTDTILTTHKHRPISPKGYNQKRYVDAIRKNDLVFGIGPAGTGKTYLAMAMAVSALLQKEVERIILVRPAVEAGERLGFLPGTLQDKVNPYLRPLFDALYDMVDKEKADLFVEREIVEVAPLAFMRGRSLNNAFVILDEAQNTSTEQMKMFLTRLGFQSSAIVTGDITQTDLPSGMISGLVECQRVLDGVKGIAFCHFDESDIVRHPLVQRIVQAYAKDEDEREKRRVQRREQRKSQNKADSK